MMPNIFVILQKMSYKVPNILIDAKLDTFLALASW